MTPEEAAENKKIQRQLRDEGLGRIEDVASRRTEGSRLKRSLITDRNYTVEPYEKEQLVDAYAQFFWNHKDDPEYSDRDVVIAWLYGVGWQRSRIAAVVGTSGNVVYRTIANLKEKALEEFLT